MKRLDFHNPMNEWHVVLLAMFLSAVVFAGAETVPHQTGRFVVQFDQYSPLSSTEALMERMKVSIKPGSIDKHYYAIKEESFEVYVPGAYEPNTPFGLLVWISPNPDGSIERYLGFRELMDQHRLIWVGANRSGNETDLFQRRIPLALDAAYNMPKLYTVDPNRIYVAGVSGGGRVASITAFHHSDIYHGGVFIIGANYWKPASIPEQNIVLKANAPRPRPEYLLRAKEHGRYVLLTGDTDVNRPQMHTYYEGLRKDLNHVLYIQVPGMGHEVPPPKAFDEALDYIDISMSQKAESGN